MSKDTKITNISNESEVPEFSRIVEVDSIPSLGRTVKLEATREQLDALSVRLDLPSFDEFKIAVKVIPLGRSSIVRVEGHIEAKLSQACVVSLKPVPAHIDEEFELDFAPETGDDQIEREFVLSEGDPYEPLEDGKIDVAELATQQLSLSLDLYPRAEGVDINEIQKAAENEGRKFEVNGAKSNPFSVLAKLKEEKK